ncbi:DUF106 domain-containing protein [Candidatus Woesearchaeota archaeon]|nr:DUF106 domain-containing protein [Candidatus Woesearchaeota archaeon]
MALTNLLDPLLDPLLALPSLWAIFILSLFISVVMVFAYKLFTNQTMMKSFREDIKKLQGDMKNERENPKKMLEIQQQIMQKNSKYMMESFKPTLITFIPLIFMFAWMNAHLAYHALPPDQPFTLTAYVQDGVTGTVELFPNGLELQGNATQIISQSKVSWQLSGKERIYTVNIRFQENVYEQIIQIDPVLYQNPEKLIRKNGVEKIVVTMNRVRPLGNDFNLFGWYPGWLGVYITLSLVFSMTLRKVMGVH